VLLEMFLLSRVTRVLLMNEFQEQVIFCNEGIMASGNVKVPVDSGVFRIIPGAGPVGRQVQSNEAPSSSSVQMLLLLSVDYSPCS
jgi:hypothetical protein